MAFREYDWAQAATVLSSIVRPEVVAHVVKLKQIDATLMHNRK